MSIESIICPHCREEILLSEAVSLQIEEKLHEDFKLKLRDKDKLIEGLRDRISDLNHKAEVGSQQLQGEVLELDLEERLTVNFSQDKLKPIPKGIRGGDILHEIFDRRERHCGTIIWETKRTKSWSKGWIEKLKQDQRTSNADIAILLTKALPKECERFRQIDGVWVTNYACAIDLAFILRSNLVEIALTKRAISGKNSKMADLHDYLISANFRDRIEAIVETFISMKQDLDQEKRAYERIWKKREKQLDRIVSNVSCLVGDVEGIVDSNMLPIKNLELPALSDGVDE
jgi:hypothetical protein